MAIGRKAVVFTLMAILIVAFLFSSQRVARGVTSESELLSSAAETRVGLVDSYINALDQAASSALGTTAYFVMQNISTNKIRHDGFYSTTNNLNMALQNCIGPKNEIIISGIRYDCVPKNYTVNQTMTMMEQISWNFFGFQTDVKINEVWWEERNPAEVDFYLNLTYEIMDPDFNTFFTLNSTVRSTVVFEGINDPLYEYMSSSGVLPGPGRDVTTERRPFRFQGIRYQLNATTFDKTGIDPNWRPGIYMNRSYVLNQGRAPSVMQRFTGGADTSDCCGISSVMNVSQIKNSATGMIPAYMNYSMIDHHFVNHVRGIRAEHPCRSEKEPSNFDDFVKTYWTVDEDLDWGPGELLVIFWWEYDNLFNLHENDGEATSGPSYENRLSNYDSCEAWSGFGY
ncbi:hypothetical protein GOV11_02025 [Candidatus Woesearchaeota archaeon]|nr:hypothetical protein [Candidatus Woesearchaeota archaeon]